MNKLEDSPTAPESLPEWVVECLSRLFSSISDHTRIRIVHALTTQDRLNVSEIAEHTGLSVSAVSHQLRLLRDRAMLQAAREGRSVYYSLADDHLRTLIRTGVQHAYEDCTNNLRREAEDPTNQKG
ncbi:MAG: metalloregulator ArsR/SmtB family transcription factor [Acidobacteria bacterium]|jgi:DNA-binding transcriptional ArsR family regulator|nr:metalloregulator ArsR/SmtB family transcription factor [Acidobacteriota bacterium]